MKSKVLLLFLMKCRYHIKSLMSDQQTDLLVCYYASCNNLAQLFLYIYSYIVAGSVLDLPVRVTAQHKSNLYIPVAINAAFFLFCVIVANIIEVETTCWRIQNRTLRMGSVGCVGSIIPPSSYTHTAHVLYTRQNRASIIGGFYQ